MLNNIIGLVAPYRWLLLACLVTIVLLFVVSCGKRPSVKETARVVEVVDGDSILVEIHGRVYGLRYIGINAPEMDSADGRPEPFAVESTKANKMLVAGQIVTLVKDVSDIDQYGRLLRYVYVGDSFINAELVRMGIARANAYPPDTRLQPELYAAQDQARKAHLGLWSQP